ncbi:dipeptide ABC transporter ATP-binding protein [Lacisediminihabitans sp.]|uniref:dipeptide ABC transporter ATP-binding protein n=1 Tax=Lacisediminihabitans sp. TaxID=2787631 RepID=UPI00374D51E1
MTGIVESTRAERVASPHPREGRLRVSNLTVSFRRGGREHRVVNDLSFELEPGECIAIVGESGSGKSVTARTIVGLTGGRSTVTADEISLDGESLIGATARQWRSIRGRRIGFILQDALVSLDPLRPVGREIDEALRLHHWGNRAERKRKVIDLLDSVGVPNPQNRARQRPDELSGGLRQRALIASALALDPEIIIADEPTTALDATVQAQVLSLIADMKSRGVSVILISHDLSVVAQLADHILVMRGGHVLEAGAAHQVLHDPRHEYTRSLIDAVPSEHTRGRPLGAPVEIVATPHPPRVAEEFADYDGPVLEAKNLVKRFPTPDGRVDVAVDDVSFTLDKGKTLGIVGESGSGKSTTARLALALTRPDGGSVTLLGRNWTTIAEPRRRALRGRISVVYQDPLSSFDPRWNAERILLDSLPAELDGDRPARRVRVRELAGLVGLPEDVLRRFPLQLSGGQRQRIAIARALAPSPSVIVLDEAVSALDVSIQAQILDLLVELQRQLELSYLFISHDLGVISHMSDHVLVMKDGAVVERGTPDQIFNHPRHPYTRQLVSSVPTLDD